MSDRCDGSEDGERSGMLVVARSEDCQERNREDEGAAVSVSARA